MVAEADIPTTSQPCGGHPQAAPIVCKKLFALPKMLLLCGSSSSCATKEEEKVHHHPCLNQVTLLHPQKLQSFWSGLDVVQSCINTSIECNSTHLTEFLALKSTCPAPLGFACVSLPASHSVIHLVTAEVGRDPEVRVPATAEEVPPRRPVPLRDLQAGGGAPGGAPRGGRAAMSPQRRTAQVHLSQAELKRRLPGDELVDWALKQLPTQWQVIAELHKQHGLRAWAPGGAPGG